MKRSQKDEKNKAEDEDAALFRAAIGEVNPVPDQNRIKLQNPPRKPFPRTAAVPPSVPDTLSDFAAENPPEEFLRNGMSRLTLRKLRRDYWPVQDRLDLHGINGDEARKLLQEFLHEAIRRDSRCVLVIHGKGLNSKGGEAVLRKLTRHWLAQYPHVLAFCNAAPEEGGSGAALVLLKTIPT